MTMNRSQPLLGITSRPIGPLGSVVDVDVGVTVVVVASENCGSMTNSAANQTRAAGLARKKNHVIRR